jgi:hypothetical protein
MRQFIQRQSSLAQERETDICARITLVRRDPAARLFQRDLDPRANSAIFPFRRVIGFAILQKDYDLKLERASKRDAD